MELKYLKALVLACGALLMSAVAYAGDIDDDEALAIARKFLKGKNLVPVSCDNISSRRNAAALKYPAFYIYNAENEGGFVIVNGDDEANPVLGYSDKGSFNPSNLHPFLSKYLENYNEVTASNGARRASVTPGTIIVDALCKSQWGQDAPFDLYTPTIGGLNTPCGCVATAMAQIMRHFEWPACGRGSIVYNCPGYGVISRDFSQNSYNWAVMQDKGGMIRNTEVREAMGLIAYDAGLSVRMSYSPSGSGAYEEDARKALATTFQYKASTARVLHRECYATQNEWLDIIRAELDSNRPILYCAQDTINGGHAYVVDGYDSNGYVHVNWGWNGDSNGFYDITSFTPDETVFDFCDFHRMIVGIEPDFSGEDTQMAQYYLYMENAPECSGSQKLGKPFILTYKNIFNVGFDSHTYTIGVGLYDEDGNLIKNISVKSSEISMSYTQQFKPSYGFGTFHVAASLDEEFPEGKYALRCIFCEKDYDEWLLPETVGGSAVNWIPIVVKDGKVYLNSPDGPTPPLPDAIYNICVDGSDSEVVSRTYYNINGTRVITPKRGEFIIERQMLRNGKVKTLKRRF